MNEEDPKFPESLQSKNPVAPSEIVSMTVIDLEKKAEAYHYLKEIVDSFKIRVER